MFCLAGVKLLEVNSDLFKKVKSRLISYVLTYMLIF